MNFIFITHTCLSEESECSGFCRCMMANTYLCICLRKTFTPMLTFWKVFSTSVSLMLITFPSWWTLTVIDDWHSCLSINRLRVSFCECYSASSSADNLVWLRAGCCLSCFDLLRPLFRVFTDYWYCLLFRVLYPMLLSCILEDMPYFRWVVGVTLYCPEASLKEDSVMMTARSCSAVLLMFSMMARRTLALHPISVWYWWLLLVVDCCYRFCLQSEILAGLHIIVACANIISTYLKSFASLDTFDPMYLAWRTDWFV